MKMFVFNLLGTAPVQYLIVAMFGLDHRRSRSFEEEGLAGRASCTSKQPILRIQIIHVLHLATQNRDTSKQVATQRFRFVGLNAHAITPRYDLLCIEGIARALRIYLGKEKPPQYKLVYPKGGEASLITATIAPEVRGVLLLHPDSC